MLFFSVAECPEEETRSLFEQLQANKESKEREYEEQFKMRKFHSVVCWERGQGGGGGGHLE